MKQLAKYLSGVSLLALLVAAPLAAQGPSYGGLTMKAGLSYGDVSNSGVFPGGARTRSGAALGIGILSGGPLGFGIEALYAQRGIIGIVGVLPHRVVNRVGVRLRLTPGFRVERAR
jgi:hypothetical protein